MSSLPLITSAFLTLTHACSMRCVYCFVHQNPEYMSFSVAKDSADFLYRNAELTGSTTQPSINFFGGEPLLCWDSVIVPLTEYIRGRYGNNFALAMTTNGALLTPEKLEFMNKNHIGMLLSIDGDRETQEYNRPLHNGASSFDAVKDILPLVVSQYPNSTFRSTIIPDTCHNTFHNIQFAIQNGFKSFFVVPNTFEHWDEEHRGILEGEMRKYSEYFIDCYRGDIEPPKFSLIDRMFRRIGMINVAVANNQFRSGSNCRACGKCGLGSSHAAAIDCNGNLYGCQEMTSNEGIDSVFYIGNIYDGVDDTLRERLMSRFDEHTVYGDDCSSCRLNRVCDGGCVAHNYLITGELHRVSPSYCWWSRLILDEVIYICNVLGEERNERFKSFLMERGRRDR